MDVIARDEEPLSKVIDLAKYLSEPAWDLEGCALVGKQIHELAVTAQQQHRGAVEALRVIERGLDGTGPLEFGARRSLHSVARAGLKHSGGQSQ
jgi:hypothetical protein